MEQAMKQMTHLIYHNIGIKYSLYTDFKEVKLGRGRAWCPEQ